MKNQGLYRVNENKKEVPTKMDKAYNFDQKMKRKAALALSTKKAAIA